MTNLLALVTIMEICLVINFILAMINWYKGDNLRSVLCTITGFLCSLIVVGIKHYA